MKEPRSPGGRPEFTCDLCRTSCYIQVRSHVTVMTPLSVAVGSLPVMSCASHTGSDLRARRDLSWVMWLNPYPQGRKLVSHRVRIETQVPFSKHISTGDIKSYLHMYNHPVLSRASLLAKPKATCRANPPLWARERGGSKHRENNDLLHPWCLQPINARCLVLRVKFSRTLYSA